MRKLLALIALSIAFGNTQAQIGVPGPIVVTGPGPHCKSLKLDQEVPCPDSVLYSTLFGSLVERPFQGRDFRRLDELFEQWSKGVDRFPDGRWKLTTFAKNLSSMFESLSVTDDHFARIRRWQSEYPQSFAAKYAEALYWTKYAWKARGSNYGSSGESVGGFRSLRGIRASMIGAWRCAFGE
jgi:hypothetical protein